MISLWLAVCWSGCICIYPLCTSRALVISIGEVNALHPPHLITSPNYPDKSPLACVCVCVLLDFTDTNKAVRAHRSTHTIILGTDTNIHWMHRHKTAKQRINSQPVSLTSRKAAEKVFEIQRVIRGKRKQGRRGSLCWFDLAEIYLLRRYFHRLDEDNTEIKTEQKKSSQANTWSLHVQDPFAYANAHKPKHIHFWQILFDLLMFPSGFCLPAG